MSGGCDLLQAAPDEPDLIPAPGSARIVVNSNHVSVTPELVGGAHDLPQQADLTTHRLLCGRPKERPVSQSESTASSTHPHTKRQLMLGSGSGHVLVK